VTRRVVYSPEAQQQLTDLYLWIAAQSGLSSSPTRSRCAVVVGAVTAAER